MGKVHIVANGTPPAVFELLLFLFFCQGVRHLQPDEVYMTPCKPDQTWAPIKSFMQQQINTVVMTQLAWICAINSLWETTAARLKCVRFRTWVCVCVCVRHFARLMQWLNSPHSWNVSCLSRHTPHRGRRNINSPLAAAPSNAQLTGWTEGLAGI